jgi:DNA-binding transcriptional LysR family regulator
MPIEPLLALPQLRTFYGVALSHSFSAAAARLGRTPSAVSHAIRTLEDTVGVRLVERRGRTVRLTEDGQRLLSACTAVYALLDEAGEALRRSAVSRRRRIRLGAPPEFGCSVLMGLIAPFLREHRDIEVDFRLSHDLLTPLQRDDIDIAIDCVEHLDPDLAVVPLFRETYMVVCAPDFQRQHALRSPAGLAGVPVLSLDKEGAWWRRLLRVVPARRRPRLEQVVAVNHVRAMIAGARSGMGVALVPSYAVRADVERGLLVRLFRDLTLPEDRFRIFQKRAHEPLERHRRLVAFLRSADPREFGLETKA